MLKRLESLVQKRLIENKLRKLEYPVIQTRIDFSSNDYISFSRNRGLAKKIEEAYDKFCKLQPRNSPVMGSTGSRLLSGNFDIFHDTESFLSDFHRQPYSMLANSGWDLNFGVLASLPDQQTCVIYDELSHNSVIMGIRAGRQQNTFSFRHNDLDHLKEVLDKNNNVEEKLIVVESIYSMDGDECPLKDLFDIAYHHNAYVVVDEAHSSGVYGSRGEGLVCSLGLHNHTALLGVVHTFGKAIGQHGAIFVTPHKVLIPILLNYSRPLIYSTALPIHSVLSIKASYEELLEPSSVKSRNYLFELVHYFRSKCADLSIPLLPSVSPIQGVLLPGNDNVVRAAADLKSKGFSCFPIRAPTVAVGEERIRIVLHSHNSIEEVDALCFALRALPHFLVNT